MNRVKSLLAVKSDGQDLYAITDEGTIQVFDPTSEAGWKLITEPTPLLKRWAEVELEWQKRIKGR